MEAECSDGNTSDCLAEPVILDHAQALRVIASSRRDLRGMAKLIYGDRTWDLTFTNETQKAQFLAALDLGQKDGGLVYVPTVQRGMVGIALPSPVQLVYLPDDTVGIPETPPS